MMPENFTFSRCLVDDWRPNIQATLIDLVVGYSEQGPWRRSCPAHREKQISARSMDLYDSIRRSFQWNNRAYLVSFLHLFAD